MLCSCLPKAFRVFLLHFAVVNNKIGINTLSYKITFTDIRIEHCRHYMLISLEYEMIVLQKNTSVNIFPKF